MSMLIRLVRIPSSIDGSGTHDEMPVHQHYPTDTGERLRIARETAGLTQAAAASKISVARTTLVAIEKGDRRVRALEVQQLARAYGISVNSLLRREAIFVSLVPRFRRLSTSGDEAGDRAATLLESLVRAEVELETLLGVGRQFNYPPERPLLRGDVRAQAEHDATELRTWLGLGLAPVRDLISLLELDIGMRVYVRPLESTVSGLFAYDTEFGACMLLNASYSMGRRNQTGAHELGHFISSRSKPVVMRADKSSNSREERYANAFGRAFLTPARTIMQQFREVTAGASHLTRRHVIVLAHSFNVPREAMVRRLEQLRLARRGSWEWFQDHGGITNVMEQRVLGNLDAGEIEDTSAGRHRSFRLLALAEQAWQQGLLSEGQLAELLRIDQIELRRLLDDIAEEGSQDEALELPDWLH